MIMSPQLKLMFDTANKFVEKHFRAAGEILPMYHAEQRDGDHFIMPAPDGDKDTSIAVVRAAFILQDVVRYVFVDEAWMVNLGNQPPQDPFAIKASTHPDRREAIMFSMEEENGGQWMAHRFILRPEHGRAKLSPLNEPVSDMLEGRMIGLLPQRGTRQ